MKGIELSRAFYDEYGKAMLETEFPDILPFLAAGITGGGSECFGVDDDISQDHDFEPGFCIFLPGEDRVDRRQAFLLERAYAKLPKEFMGFKRSTLQPVGGARKGVLRIDEFLTEKTGTPDGDLSNEQWMRIPEQSLAEAVNGEIFLDNAGELTRIRKKLEYFPEDIRLKKLAGNLLLMAQSGQYNYVRCLKHGETAAAQMAVFEFAKSTMSAVFLLNRRYMPYYKWSFRALRRTLGEEELADKLSILLTTGLTEETAEDRYVVIEDIASDVIDRLQRENLTDAVCGDLEKHAYSVNDRVKDGEIRNLHILAGV